MLHALGFKPIGRTVLQWMGCFLVAAFLISATGVDAMSQNPQETVIHLPEAAHQGTASLEQTLLQRRSIRRFADEPLTLEQVSQLLWAAQGVTHTRGFRTAPSAGALYPLETYLIAGQVSGLEAGVYQYLPAGHSLITKATADKRNELSRAALGQAPVSQAPATILFAAVYGRTTGRYGQRGVRYVHMEAGHAAQNILLQAISLGLGGVVIGAFEDERIQTVIGLETQAVPLYLIPVGR